MLNTRTDYPELARIILLDECRLEKWVRVITLNSSCLSNERGNESMESVESPGLRVVYSDLNFADGFLFGSTIKIAVKAGRGFPFRSVVVCVRGDELTGFLEANPTWRMSDSLNAAYKYLRSPEGEGFVNLRLMGLSEGHEISVEPWRMGQEIEMTDFIEGIFQRGFVGEMTALERLA